MIKFLLSFGFDWKNTIFFDVYKFLSFPNYFIISFTYVLQHLYFLNTINYCAAYFGLVCIKIQRLNQDLPKFNDYEIKEALKDIVKHHVIALDLSKMLQDITRYYMLFYHLLMIAVMCFLTFLISYVSIGIKIYLF